MTGPRNCHLSPGLLQQSPDWPAGVYLCLLRLSLSSHRDPRSWPLVPAVLAHVCWLPPGPRKRTEHLSPVCFSNAVLPGVQVRTRAFRGLLSRWSLSSKLLSAILSITLLLYWSWMKRQLYDSSLLTIFIYFPKTCNLGLLTQPHSSRI